MGFLSKIFKSAIDPAGLFKKDQKLALPATANQPATDDPTQAYYGDSQDDQYGDFTKPFGVEEFYNYADPGYAFQLQQGNQALQNSAAAGSGAMSGAALKDLMSYNQQYAGSSYNDAFNRYQTQQGNIFSRLSSLAQLGQNAAAGVGAQGTQLAGQAGQSLQAGGAAAGAGLVGAGNALGQGATNYWLYGTPQGRSLWQQGTGGV